MAGRRNFLRAFGIASVALPTVTLAGTEVEVVNHPDVKPIQARTDRMYDHAFDVVTGQLYSARTLSEGRWISELSFFDYGIDGERTIADTNLHRAGSLWAPEMFAVQKIGMIFSPGADPVERSRFIDTFTLEFWIGQKMYWRGPLAQVFAVGERKSDSPRNAEFPTHSMIDMGNLPLVLDNQVSFHARLSGGSFYANSPLKMWTVLHGMHARGVQ